MVSSDVFVSYRHADADAVAPIVAALRETGLEVWQDASRIDDFSSISGAVTHGLATSKAVLAYYSRSYASSRPCQWELTRAFLTAQQDPSIGGDVRRRILVVNPEASTAHLQPVELADARFSHAPDDPAGLAALAGRVRAHVASLAGTLGDIAQLEGPRWLGWTGVGSPRFVGRIPELWTIHSALRAASMPMMTNVTGVPIAQLCGLGGVGKSLLAEEYARRFGAAYPGGVFWLRALGTNATRPESGDDAHAAHRDAQIREFAESLGLEVQGKRPGEIVAALGSHQARQARPFLWVVDDLPAGLGAQGVRAWCAPHELGRTLITTRSQSYEGQGAQIRIGVLETGDALQLLASRRAPRDEQERDAAAAIVRQLGQHALAIDVAGSSLKRSSYAALASELREQDRDALDLAAELAGELPNGHEASIAGTLLRSIAALADEGQDFLRLATTLAAAPIPTPLVEQVFEEAELDPTAARERAARGIAQAHELSLTDPAGEDAAGVPMHSVHALVCRTVRFRDRQRERIAGLRVHALWALTHTLQRLHGIDEVRAAAPVLVHARDLSARSDEPITSMLLGWLAACERELGAWAAAREADARGYAMLRQLRGDADPETLAALNNWGISTRMDGDYHAALDLNRAALDGRRRELGEGHEDTLESRRELAVTLMSLNRLDEAELEVKRVIEVVGARPGAPSDVFALELLGEVLRRRGDVTRAASVQDGVIATRSAALGEDSPETLLSMNNRAVTMYDQGDLAGARTLTERVLAGRRRVLGEEHPHTIATIGNLGAVLLRQGDARGAVNHLEDSLKRLRTALGDGHPDVLNVMANLGDAFRRLDELPHSRAVLEEALHLANSRLGREHVMTTLIAEQLVLTLLTGRDVPAARDVLDRSLAWLLEADPGTLSADQLGVRKHVAGFLHALAPKARRGLLSRIFGRRAGTGPPV